MKNHKIEFVQDKMKLIELASNPKIEIKTINGPSPMSQGYRNNTGNWLVTYIVNE